MVPKWFKQNYIWLLKCMCENPYVPRHIKNSMNAFSRCYKSRPITAVGCHSDAVSQS